MGGACLECPNHKAAKAATNKEEYEAESDEYLELMCVNKTNVCVPWKNDCMGVGGRWGGQPTNQPTKDVTKSASAS